MLTDPTVKNDILDWCYGVIVPARPAFHDVALYGEDGLELTEATAPGYARARVDPEGWEPAVDGQKSVLVAFAPPTAEWSVAVVGWVLIDDTGRTWDDGDLVDPLVVTSASDVGPVVTVTVAYQSDADELLPNEPDPESDPDDVDPEVYVEPDDGDDGGTDWTDPEFDTTDPDDELLTEEPGTPEIP
jgi:hypothetical protein